jgi:thioredoxin
MKQLLSFFIAFTFILAGCADAQSQSVDAGKFQAGLKQSEVQLLDVRTAEEYAQGHISNAMLANVNDDAEFEHRIAALDKERPVYVYCLAGARSSHAAEILREKGFTNVVELAGGVNAWRKAGKPLEGASKQKEMSPQEYQALITQKRLVLVDFGATWCPPCRKMQPVVDELQKAFTGKVSFAQVDAGAQEGLMNTYKVEQIPTFILYQDGKEVWRGSGVIAKAEMETKLREFSNK